MTRSTKKRIGKLKEYLKRGEFAKIRDLIKLLGCTQLSTEENEMLEKAKNLLKSFMKIEIRRCLAISKAIEKIKIEVVLQMDKKYIEEMHSLIRGSTLKKYVNEFQANNKSLTKLSNVKEVLDNLSEMFDKVRFNYANLPKEWNLEGDFMFYCVLHVKEILFETYIDKWSTKEYVDVLKYIIEFEKKNTKYYFSKECCHSYREGKYAGRTRRDEKHIVNDKEGSGLLLTERRSKTGNTKNLENKDKLCNSLDENGDKFRDAKANLVNDRKTGVTPSQNDTNEQPCTGIVLADTSQASTQLILFDRDKVLTSKPNIKTNFIVLYDPERVVVSDFCKHRKMLSHLLLPNIGLLINDLFLPVKKITLNQKCVEMNLISSFVQFFRELGNVLVVIRHFESASVHELFIHEANNVLCALLASVSVTYNYKDLLVMLNTLYFVETTFLDLTENTRKWGCTSNNVSAYVRKLEKKVTTGIESILKVIFRRSVKKKYAFSNEFIEMLKKEVLVLDRIEFNESIFHFLFETLFSLLFSKMVKFKMEPRLAELLIEEIGEIRLFLEEEWPKPPLIDVIESYLKIFVCTTDNIRVFVTCFNQLNNNLFDFKNIIEALEDSSRNKQLIREYENQKDKIIKYESRK